MKVLNLRCGQQHAYEGWFASEDDFIAQQGSGIVACPLCGDTAAVRLPSAPRLKVSRHSLPAEPGPGAVMIVPLLGEDRVVVERQWRYPMGRAMLEFPAGKLEPGEPVLECAVRELIEETGYRAAEWARAGILHNAIGYSDEGIEIWFARGLEGGERSLDAGEFLDVFEASVDALEEAARRGEITDAKTLIGLLWLAHWRAGRWPLQWVAAAAPS